MRHHISTSRKKAIAVILFIVAISIFFTGVNQKHLSPFSTEVVCSDVMYNVEDDKGGAMVDRIYQTVYFYNASHQIVAVKDPESEGKMISWITGLTIQDDEIQIIGCYSEDNGIYLNAESIQAYDRDGDWIREVDRLDYDEDAHVTIPKWGVAAYADWSGSDNTSSITLTYNPWFFIKNLLYYLSLGFIFIGFCVLLVQAFRKKFFHRHKGKVLVVFAILVTTVFFVASDFFETLSLQQSTLSTTAEQIADITESAYGADIDAIVSNGDFQGYFSETTYLEGLYEVQCVLTEYLNANKTDSNYYALIYLLDANNDPDDLIAEGNKFYAGLDSRGIVRAGKEIVISDALDDALESGERKEVYYMQNGVNSILFSYSIIKNESGKPIAMVQVTSLISNILHNAAKNLETKLINLLAIFILLYVLYMLFMAFSKDLRRLKHREKSDQSGRACDMSGLYMFVFQIANTIDEVIFVYVAKSLCTGMDSALEAAMVALPLAANGAGRWIGTFLAGSVIRKFGERKTGVLASFLAIAVMLCMAISVRLNNIMLLTVCKLFQGMLLAGFIYVISDTLPLNAANEEGKKKAINHSQMSMIGAEILAALAGGYLSQYIGYELVYIAGAVLCGLLLVLTIVTFGKNSAPVAIAAQKPQKVGFGKSWSIFLKKPMLTFLFLYLLPYVLIGGYKNYIFPLYTAGAGISVLLLSNISVYGKALAFLLDDAIKKYSINTKPIITMLVPMLVFCGGLIYFLICPNVFWAIVMYFALEVVKRMSKVGQKLHILDIAEAFGMEGKLVQANYYTVESGFFVFQSPILSVFMSLGVNVGSAIVGALTFAMVSVFGLMNKKKKRINIEKGVESKYENTHS